MLIPEQFFVHVELCEEWIEFDRLPIHDCSILHLYLDDSAETSLEKEGRDEVHAVVA